MFFTVYKITNIINDKIYIGAHRSNSMYDSYMGSGTYLKLAQNKYGIENFYKEILYVYDNPEDMFLMESIIVDEDFVERKDTYNLCVGGGGTIKNKSEYINSEKHINQIRSIREKGHKSAMERIKWLKENDETWNNRRLAHLKKLQKQNKEYYKNNGGTFKNKKHKESSKIKIGEANSIHQQGENNSQYGTIWITNGEIDKKIKIGEEIPNDFYKGRKKVKHKCKLCDRLYVKNNQELFCSKLCQLKHKGGIIIDNYRTIYNSYKELGSVNKAFKKHGITYSGNRCKQFHKIRKLYKDIK